MFGLHGTLCSCCWPRSPSCFAFVLGYRLPHRLMASCFFMFSGVAGHFTHPFNRPWATIDNLCRSMMAQLVGAKESEVVIMNSLSVNLHLLLLSFYRPSASPASKRTKIIMEKIAFPSDHVISALFRTRSDGSFALVCLFAHLACFLSLLVYCTVSSSIQRL